MFPEIGKLNETRGEVSVEWKIDVIPYLLHGRGATSPPFFLSDSCWSLKICPRHDKSGSKTIYLALFREDFGPTKNVTFTLSYKKENRIEPILCRQGYAFSKSDVDDLLDKQENNFVLQAQSAWDCTPPKLTTGSTIPTPSESLTVICTIKSEDELPLEVSLIRRLWDSSRNLRKIFAGKEDTDIKLKLKDRQIEAHSIILKSRYPVFFSKFKDEARELNIEDDDEYAFDIVFSYVYSGEPQELSSENVWAVYRIARECNLLELKKLCTMFLEKNLSVNDVCDVIVKATEYQETELKNRAKEFFSKNSSQILQTCKWKSFSSDYRSLLQELMEYMMQEMSTMREELIQMKLHSSETKKP